jgi:hypothetical protein
MSSSRVIRQKSLFRLSPHNSPCHRPATTRVSRSQDPKRAINNLTKVSSHHKGDIHPHRGSKLSSNKHGLPHSLGWTTSHKTTSTHSSRTTTKVASAVVCRVAIFKVRNLLFNFVSDYNQNQRRPPSMVMGVPVQQPRGTYVQSQSQTTSGYVVKATQPAPIAATSTPFTTTATTSFPAATSHTVTTAALVVDFSRELNTASAFKPSSLNATFTPTSQFPTTT